MTTFHSRSAIKDVLAQADAPALSWRRSLQKSWTLPWLPVEIRSRWGRSSASSWSPPILAWAKFSAV